jgi:hypothetical protein
VASDAIAQPSHMNFFLVSQEGIRGIPGTKKVGLKRLNTNS